MLNQHVQILRKTYLDYRYMTNNRTGTIIDKSSQGLYTIRMDYNPEVLVKALYTQFMEIPQNVFTEWYNKNKPDIIILSGNNYHLVCSTEALESLSTKKQKQLDVFAKFVRAVCREHSKTDVLSIYRLNNLNPIMLFDIASIFNEYQILWLSDDHYSLEDLEC